MIEFYFKLRILIPIIVISICILVFLISVIKRILDTIFKNNCYQCKHYELFDVASCGGKCRYKCRLKNTYYCPSMGDKVNLVKCKEFEQKY